MQHRFRFEAQKESHESQKSRSLVYDAVIEDQPRSNAFGLPLSLNMLIETRGDFDYTGADCQASMRDADFVSTRVEPLLGRIRW